MARLSLVHQDDRGIYVQTGGYIFRPAALIKEHFSQTYGPLRLQELFEQSPVSESRDAALAHINDELAQIDTAAQTPSLLTAGMRVKARHKSGSALAVVSGELWVSSDQDPRQPH